MNVDMSFMWLKYFYIDLLKEYSVWVISSHLWPCNFYFVGREYSKYYTCNIYKINSRRK